MKRDVSLSKLSDRQLLETLSSLTSRGNRLTANLLAYLGEVDRRRLCLGQACSSMHAYCTERLHLSEGAAAKRIRVARAARRFPVILERIAAGDLHLAGAHLLAPHLTEQNHRELLARARHRSKREIEKQVAELAPKPDAPSRIRKIPAPGAEVRRPEGVRAGAERLAPEASGRPGPSAAGPAANPGAEHRAPEGPRPSAPSTPRPAASPGAGAGRPARLAPLSSRSYSLTVTLDDEAYADLQELRDLLAHQIRDRDPAAIVKRALALLKERTLANKAGLTARPNARKNEAGRTPSRHIPAEIRRAVWIRDAGRCTFRDARGRRCTARCHLEYHHTEPWARTHEHSVETIELRCRAHNAYQAELDYGAAFMRGAVKKGRAGELLAPYDREAPGRTVGPLSATSCPVPGDSGKSATAHRAPEAFSCVAKTGSF